MLIGCREQIGLAVLHLLEKGTLQKLHKKWWYDKGECVPEDTKVSAALLAYWCPLGSPTLSCVHTANTFHA